jgi:hypothetical protein
MMHRSRSIIGIALVAAVAIQLSLLAADVASRNGPPDGRGGPGAPASIQLTPDPISIACDGIDVSTITVRVTDARNRAVSDGTIVHFDARFGFVDPVEASTRHGEASTQVRFYPSAKNFPGETGVDVFTEQLRASIGVDCAPGQPPCDPGSPPGPQSPPCPPPCSTTDSPPAGFSPPCEPLPCSTTDSPPVGPSPPCIPVCDAPFSPPCDFYEMRLDAHASIGGVQQYVEHFLGEPFQLAVHATSVGDEPYAGYQWLIEWPSDALDFVSLVAEQGPSIGLDDCVASYRPPVFDPAYDDAFGGICQSGDPNTTTAYVGELTRIEMACIAPGSFVLQLVGSTLTSDFATTFLAADGSDLPTSTQNAFVLCKAPPCGPQSSPPCVTPTPPSCEPGSCDVRLAFDVDITNGSGPCTQLDDAASLSVGESRQVGVCLLNPDGAVPIAAYNYRVVYDDRIVVAPEVANTAEGLDDNPDANAGRTTFTSPAYPVALGGGWDCHGGVGAYPVGDTDGVPQDGDGTAYSGGCGSALGPNTLIEGPLGVITFYALTPGTTSLNFTRASITQDNLVELGSCAPAVDHPMLCLDATIVITEANPTPTIPAGQDPLIVPSDTPTPAPAPLGRRPQL